MNAGKKDFVLKYECQFVCIKQFGSNKVSKIMCTNYRALYSFKPIDRWKV